MKRFGNSYLQFTYAHHQRNENGSKSVIILKKYGICAIALGQLTGNTLQLNVPKNLYQNISTTKAFLALSFWQSVMTFVDIGQYGSGNDSGVLKLSHMGKCFEDNSLNVSEGSKIAGMDVELPYFLVRDEIFPLKT